MFRLFVSSTSRSLLIQPWFWFDWRPIVLLFENNKEQSKYNENNRNCKKIPYRNNTLMKTKILTKFQVYILSFSHSTAISSICHVDSVLTIKESFCKHRSPENSHNFKS